MINIQNVIITILREYNSNFSDLELLKFCKYADLLIQWNKKMNLTSIIDPEEIAVKHFIDSISVLKYIDLSGNSEVIDIGTGAGFPGIPLKIVRPDINLTLMDSLNKRLIFLENALMELGLQANLVHERAENGARRDSFREKFDFAFSRAVARLNVLSELCVPYLKKGGLFVSLKGRDVQLEVSESLNAIKKLGGNIEKIDKFKLINGNERSVVQIRKFANTPSIYPRQGAKISKKPL